MTHSMNTTGYSRTLAKKASTPISGHKAATPISQSRNARFEAPTNNSMVIRKHAYTSNNSPATPTGGVVPKLTGGIFGRNRQRAE